MYLPREVKKILYIVQQKKKLDEKTLALLVEWKNSDNKQ